MKLWKKDGTGGCQDALCRSFEKIEFNHYATEPFMMLEKTTHT
jgi:hypothetical protein